MDAFKSKLAARFPNFFGKGDSLTDRDIIHNVFQWGDASTVEQFRRFFYKTRVEDSEKFDYTPVMSGLCSAMNIVFCTGKNPDEFPEGAVGISETMSNGTIVTHLQREAFLKDMKEVMTIELKSANDIPEYDKVWGLRKADPYVRFTYERFMEQTERQNNKSNCTWNTTHSFFIRKDSVFKKDHGELKIELFDYDVGNKKDQLIASCTVAMDEIKSWSKQEKTFDLKPTDGSKGTPNITLRVVFQEPNDYLKSVEQNHNIKWFNKTLDEMNPWCNWLELSQTLSSLEDMRINPTERPVVFFNSPETDTQGYISVDHTTGSVLVTFRGTQITRITDDLIDIDIRTDSVCYSDDELVLKGSENLKAEDARVHDGFLRAYNSVREAVLQTVYSLSQWKEDWFVGLSGHSLGGALAVLCAYEIANRKTSDGKCPDVGMFSVGAPKVGKPGFIKKYNETVNASIRFVKHRDPVPRLPPNFSHVNNKVLFRGDEAEEFADEGDFDENDEEGKSIWRSLFCPREAYETIMNHLQAKYFEDIGDLVLGFIPFAEKSKTKT